ncbi:MAG TPA: hypothetical protein VFP50_15435 [Anaeromyxobacteraceae bacterium]|nr:hypothetical protein [Anaeromyxobacteraceae bacterium]
MVVLFGVFLAACGPGLDPSIAGTWRGNAAYSFSGLATQNVGASVIVSVTVDQARIVGMCPDGGGSLVVQGAADRATWSGTTACPPVPFGGCGAVALTYTSAALTHGSGDTITIEGAGYGDGCGTRRSLSVSFFGTR